MDDDRILPDIHTLDDARVRIVSLEERVLELEKEMLTCLKWMRIQAETEAAKTDPNVKLTGRLKS